MTRRRAMTVALLTLLIGIAIPSCVKDTTFNPHAAPDNGELDRLQKIIDDRPTSKSPTSSWPLSTTRFAQRSTVLPEDRDRFIDTQADRGCTDPYGHNIGHTFTIEKLYARPAPTDTQFHQITTALRPIVDAARFAPNTPANVTPPAGTFSQISGDGSTIELINSPGAVLVLRVFHRMPFARCVAHGTTACRSAPGQRSQRPPSLHVWVRWRAPEVLVVDVGLDRAEHVPSNPGT